MLLRRIARGSERTMSVRHFNAGDADCTDTGTDTGPGVDLVVVDDAHLLDAASAGTLARLARTGRAKLLLSLPAGARGPEELMQLWSSGSLEGHTIGALTWDEARRLLESTMGGTVAFSAVDSLWAETDGNPRLFGVLLDRLREGGAFCESGGTWSLALSLAETDALHGVDAMAEVLPGATQAQRTAVELLALSGTMPYDELAEFVPGADLDHLEDAGLLAVLPGQGRLEARLVPGTGARMVALSVGPTRAGDLAGLLASSESTERPSALRRSGSREGNRMAVARGTGRPDDAGAAPAATNPGPCAAVLAGTSHGTTIGTTHGADLDAGPCAAAAGIDRVTQHARAGRFDSAEALLSGILDGGAARPVGGEAHPQCRTIALSLRALVRAVSGNMGDAIHDAETVAAALPELPLPPESADDAWGRVFLVLILAGKWRRCDQLLGAMVVGAVPHPIHGNVRQLMRGLVQLLNGCADDAGATLEGLLDELFPAENHPGSAVAAAASALAHALRHNAKEAAVPGRAATGAAGTVAVAPRVAVRPADTTGPPQDADRAGDALADYFRIRAECGADHARAAAALMAAAERLQAEGLVGFLPLYVGTSDRLAHSASRPDDTRAFDMLAALHAADGGAGHDLEVPGLDRRGPGRRSLDERGLDERGVGERGAGKWPLLAMEMAAARARADGDADLYLRAAQIAAEEGNDLLAFECAKSVPSATTDTRRRRMARDAMNSARRRLTGEDRIRQQVRDLSEFEHSLAYAAAHGSSSLSLARRLHLSVRTIDWHLGRIYDRLHVSSRGELLQVLG